jgi:hypothetical protein
MPTFSPRIRQDCLLQLLTPELLQLLVFAMQRNLCSCRAVAVSGSNSRWDGFSDEELESISQAFRGAEEMAMLDQVGVALLNELQNEIDSR